MDDKLIKAATNAAATLNAVYQWIDMIDQAGGATSISGIAKCNAMLNSLKKNRSRMESLVMAPLREVLEKADG